MSVTMYQLSKEFREAIDNGFIFNEETGELIDGEELNTALDQLQMDIFDKLDNTACVVKEMNVEISGLDEQIKLLQERKKNATKKRDRLVQYVGDQLSSLGEKKLETARNVISSRKSESVEIIDEALIAEEYFEFKPSVKKAEIKKAIKEGKDVAGATIVTKVNWSFK